MWEGNLGRASIAKHGSELTPITIQPVNSATYKADVTRKTFATMEINRIPRKVVSELAATECASSVLFTSRKLP